MMKYPRVVVLEKTHAKVLKIAKKKKTTQKAIGNKIVLAGLRALGWA